jgi:integrase
MKLTAKLVTTIQSSGADFMIWDEQVRGLALRVRAGGGKSFIVKTRVGSGRNAKQTLLTLGKPESLPLDEARTKARLLVLEAATGSQPVAKVKPTPPEECPTVGGLCALWLEKGSTRSRQRGRLAGTVRNPKNVAIDRGRINAHILPLLGKVPLSDMTRKRVEGFRDAVARGDTAKIEKTKLRGRREVKGGEGTASRTLRLLSSILSFGVREDLLAANPALGVEKTPDRTLERFLSPDEMRSLGEAIVYAEDHGGHSSGIGIIRMLALSGARKGEIENLSWHEVDLKTGFLRLSTSKTGAKLIPISGPMHEIFEAQAARKQTQWVFPDSLGNGPFQGTPKLWTKIRAHAGLADVRLHDLRHSAASFGLAGGLGLEVIGKLLGHQDIKTTRRYAHLSDGFMKAAAESMAGEIADLLKPSGR